MCQKFEQEKALQIKLEEEIYQENFISYIEAYYELTLTYEQEGIRKLHHDLKNEKSNRQTSYHKDYFSMNFSEHINGIASAITCT